MAHRDDDPDYIYDKTNDFCACREGKLLFTNCGPARAGVKGQWEVVHRRAESRGGINSIGHPWTMCLPRDRGMGPLHADRWCGA